MLGKEVAVGAVVGKSVGFSVGEKVETKNKQT